MQCYGETVEQMSDLEKFPTCILKYAVGVYLPRFVFCPQLLEKYNFFC